MRGAGGVLFDLEGKFSFTSAFDELVCFTKSWLSIRAFMTQKVQPFVVGVGRKIMAELISIHRSSGFSRKWIPEFLKETLITASHLPSNYASTYIRWLNQIILGFASK